ncbi:MAG: TIGR02611 family protein [Nostocoides sp.]
MTGPDLRTAGEAAIARDWAWRRRIRANPPLYAVYRALVFVAGLAVVVVGILLVPLPGPGWVIVFLGLAIWGSEFQTAQRLLGFVRGNVRAGATWAARQPWWLKALAGVAVAAQVLAVIWVMLWIRGVPGFLPDALESWLRMNLRLD